MLTWAILEEPISVVTYGPSFYILQILQTKSRFSFDYGSSQPSYVPIPIYISPMQNSPYQQT